MIAFLLGWLLSLLIGLAVVAGLIGLHRRQPMIWPLMLGLSILLGLGLSSLPMLGFLAGAHAWGLPLIGLDVLLLIVTGSLAMQLRRGGRHQPGDLVSDAAASSAPSRWPARIIMGWCGLIALASAWLGVINLSRRPWGDWDAIMIWNLRARFFHRVEEQFMIAFSQPVIHTDYPLSIPLSVARLWVYQQLESPLSPQSISLLTFIAVVLIVGPVVAICRGALAGAVAVGVLLANPLLILFGTLQLADVPLGACLVAGWAMVLLSMTRPTELQNSGPPSRESVYGLALAGLLWGCMIWIKNEGLMLLLCSGPGLLVVRSPRWWVTTGLSAGLALLAGLIPFALVLILAKLSLAGSNDLIRSQGGGSEMLAKLVDLSRHRAFWTVAGSYLINTPTAAVKLIFVLLVIFAGWSSRNTGRLLWGMGLSIALMMAGFYTVYLLTPHDLQWHLSSSLSRLMTQLWPVFVLWAMLGLNLPWKTAGRLG